MGETMPNFAELDEIARVLAVQSHVTANAQVARELWRLAQDYRVKAGALDGGKLPYIGDPPLILAPKNVS
jgi:hypothetical protein